VTVVIDLTIDEEDRKSKTDQILEKGEEEEEGEEDNDEKKTSKTKRRKSKTDQKSFTDRRRSLIVNDSDDEKTNDSDDEKTKEDVGYSPKTTEVQAQDCIKFKENGYALVDIDMSPEDKKNMSNFCDSFIREKEMMKEASSETNDERKVFSVPLETLPPCCKNIFSPALLHMLKQYFEFRSSIVGVQLVRDCPQAQQESTHRITELGYGHRLTLELVFESYVTTWLIPGSQKTSPYLKRRASSRQHIQPCSENSKCALLYDSNLLRCYAGNGNNETSRMLFHFEIHFPISMENNCTPKYYYPGVEMTNKEVLKCISETMGEDMTMRYDVEAFQNGNISPVTPYELSDTNIDDLKLSLFGVDDDDSDDDHENSGIQVYLSVYLPVCL
jgi:hypothetical protein